MSEEIKQKKERFEDNWKTFCDIVNSEGDTQAKIYLDSFIQSEIESALQKRDEAILKEAEKKAHIGISNKPEFIIKLKDLENIIKSKL